MVPERAFFMGELTPLETMFFFNIKGGWTMYYVLLILI